MSTSQIVSEYNEIKKVLDSNFYKCPTNPILENELLLKLSNLNSSILNVVNLSTSVSDPKIIDSEKGTFDERLISINEDIILKIAYHLISVGKIGILLKLLNENEPFLSLLPMAKMGKIIKCILERMLHLKFDLDSLLRVFIKFKNWCDEKKRTFLGYRIEIKIIFLLILKRRYTLALEKVTNLITSIAMVEDKQFLLDAYIVQSKIHLLLSNYTLMKMSLGNAKNISINLSTPSYVNGELDLLSGLISLYEKDYKSAYSYFYEAYDSFYSSLTGPNNKIYPFIKVPNSTTGKIDLEDEYSYTLVQTFPTMSELSPVFFTFYSLDHSQVASDIIMEDDTISSSACDEEILKIFRDTDLDYSVECPILEETDLDFPPIPQRKLIQALKYMLLAAILTDKSHMLSSLLFAKNKIAYVDYAEILMIRNISELYSKNSLVGFEEILKNNERLISADPILNMAITNMYENLMEESLLKIIKPFSRVSVEYIAERLGIAKQVLIRKVSEMIIDGKLSAMFDLKREEGILTVYEPQTLRPMHKSITSTIKNLSSVIDVLTEIAQKTV